MLKYLGSFCHSLCLFGLLLSCVFYQPTTAFAIKRELATIIEVVDGDTLRVYFKGKKDLVRLIGVDAPEHRANGKAQKDAKKTRRSVKTILSLGEKSTEHLKKILTPGEVIELEFDVRPRDSYGRILAYVYLKGGEMLNARLLREGSVKLYTVPPDVKYVKTLKAAYKLRPR